MKVILEKSVTLEQFMRVINKINKNITSNSDWEILHFLTQASTEIQFGTIVNYVLPRGIYLILYVSNENHSLFDEEKDFACLFAKIKCDDNTGHDYIVLWRIK